jgi:ribosomal protein L11 methyltransferase
MSKAWRAIDVMTSPDAQEAIEYGLMEAGALGTENNAHGPNVAVIGYFDSSVDPAAIQEALHEALRIYRLPASAIVALNSRDVADADWLAEWKKSWRETVVGRFIVAPPWLDWTPPTSRSGESSILIRINPGMAFGTGTHETTRLCLKAIEKHFRGGSFLDVGTGTGILAIAAAKMSPDARVEARDIDAEAIEMARENARLNKIHRPIEFQTGSVDEQTASADFVCANLTASVIADLLPALLGVTCGTLVLSGILDSQLDMIESRLAELGATVREVDRDGEWIALVV